MYKERKCEMSICSMCHCNTGNSDYHLCNECENIETSECNRCEESFPSEDLIQWVGDLKVCEGCYD